MEYAFDYITIALVIWFLLFPIIIVSLYFFDSKAKQKYSHVLNTYKLKRTKYLFIYSKRKEGVITKFTFWLNIVFYISILLTIVFTCLAIIIDTQMFSRVVRNIIIILLIITWFLIGLLESIRNSKYDKIKKQHEKERHIQAQKESEDWLKKRAAQQQKQQQHQYQNPINHKKIPTQQEKEVDTPIQEEKDSYERIPIDE